MSSDSLNSEKMFRSRWSESEKGHAPLSVNELYRILHRNSIVARLRRRALMLFILGCTGPLWMALLTKILHVSLLLQISYVALLFISGCIQLYWRYRLSKIYEYMTIPIMEAQAKIENLQRLRKQIKIGSWIIGIPVIALLLFEVYKADEPFMFEGALFGGAIGMAIGLGLEYLNRKQLKVLKRSFAEFKED